MAERVLTVKIVGDDRSLQQAFNRSTKKTKEFQGRTSSLGKELRGAFQGAGLGGGGLLFGSAAFLSTAALTQGLRTSLDAASDLNEEVNKSKEVFGASSTAIQEWSKNTARSIGISQAEALQASGVFGNLFRSVHIGEDESATLSKRLVELAADLASFNNASPEDTLAALRSGLVGQARPLRQYGVFLSEARTQQLAMAETGKKNAKELTDQEKVLARYNIILKDTTLAQGDFARTSEGLANQERVLRAQLTDTEALIGTLLIPTVTDAAEATNLLLTGLLDIGKIRDIHINIGIDFPDPPGWLSKLLSGAALAPISPAGAAALGIKHAFFTHPPKVKVPGIDISQLQPGQIPGFEPLPFPALPILPPAPTPKVKPAVPPPPDPFADLKKADEKRRRQALAASRDHRRAEREFNAFVAGMGLKIDTAALTKSTADDLAALRQLEGAILRRINAEGRTFKLVTQLIDVRSRISDILEQNAADATQKASDAYANAIDALDLKLDIAKTTRTVNDDIRVLKQIESQILSRIRVEGRTTDLLRQLFENRQAQAQTLRDQRNANLFEALGLTATGDEKAPGGPALLRRARNLADQLEAAGLGGSKMAQRLRKITQVIKGNLRTMGREVRQAILGMLNDISSALKSQDKTGPLTKFAKTGIGNLIKGLGLTTEQERALFARMSQVGPGGSIPATGTSAFGMAIPGSRTTTGRTGRGGIPEQHDFTFRIYIDGQEVEATVTRRQQRKQGRNARSRRGVRPGR